MNFIHLPDHSLAVSRVCLGTMMFGDKCDYPATEMIVKRSLEVGFNFFDTAAMYSNGVCEEYLGRALRGSLREKLFITTKVVKGINRQSILESIDESLARLKMDYVDLYLIHWPVAGMKIKEMMQALNDVVCSGKTRLVGCCNFPAYLVAASNAIAAENGWAKLVNNQVAYNLFERGVEVEILPQALLENIAITAYRPLAVGLLTGNFLPGAKMNTANRGAADSRVITWLAQHGHSIERFVQYAAKKNITPVQLAAAWVMHNPAIAAPIMGVSSLAQVDAAASVCDVKLSDVEYNEVTDLFHTGVFEEGYQLFPGLTYNFPRLRRNLSVAVRE